MDLMKTYLVPLDSQSREDWILVSDDISSVDGDDPGKDRGKTIEKALSEVDFSLLLAIVCEELKISRVKQSLRQV